MNPTQLDLCTAALLPELQPAPCFLSAIIGQTWLLQVCLMLLWLLMSDTPGLISLCINFFQPSMLFEHKKQHLWHSLCQISLVISNMKFTHKLVEQLWRIWCFPIQRVRCCTCMTEIAAQEAFQRWPPSEMTCLKLKGKLVVSEW